LLRKIDTVLDLSSLRSQLAPHYSHTGRLSIDPDLMIRMLLIGYCYDVRSERRLWEEVHLNLTDRWFCRLGLESDVPDHTCPRGTRLQQYRRNFEHERGRVTKANTRIYRASKVDCGPCAPKQQFCPCQLMRKIITSIHEAARDVVRRFRGTPEYLQSRRDRKKVDVVRPSETHLEIGSSEIARLLRRA
jgi:hypothetical protein